MAKATDLLTYLLTHCDLKAENFVLSGQERTIRLIDFGFACKSDNLFGQAGTHDYMAPEFLDTEHHYTNAVDMWALGVLLFTMVTGETLIEGPDEAKLKMAANPTYVRSRLDGRAMKQVKASAEARDLLRQMFCREPSQRITAIDALEHPFIKRYSKQYLGERVGAMALDDAFVAKFRAFAALPALAKIATLAMAHRVTVSIGSDDKKDEICKVRQLFRTIDIHGDGVISLDQLKGTLQDAEVQIPADLENVLGACDLCLPGSLTYVEFCACLFTKNVLSDALLAEIFSIFDKQQNGRLDAKDLVILCEGYGYDLDSISSMLEEVTSKGKVWLDYEDFVAMMRA